MRAANDVLNELIKIAHEGQLFYREAALRISDARLAEVFMGLAESRAACIADLASWIARHGGDLSYDGTLLVAMRRLYAEGQRHLAADHDGLDLDRFEELEDLVLEYYQTAEQTAPDLEARRVLQRHLQPMLAAHERLRAMKRRQQEAA